MDRAQQADDLLGVAVPVSVPLSISSNSFDESQFGKKVSVAVLINKSYILTSFASVRNSVPWSTDQG